MYEAGADAMLEALKERGTRVAQTRTVIDNMYGVARTLEGSSEGGTLVFIPDTEGE